MNHEDKIEVCRHRTSSKITMCMEFVIKNEKLLAASE